MILNEKVFIVTGASSGIGEELSRALALKGAKVVCAARRNDELERVCSAISSSGGSALPIQADITDLDQCLFLVQKTVDVYGHIDGIVQNAGLSMRARFADISKINFFNIRSRQRCLVYLNL